MQKQLQCSLLICTVYGSETKLEKQKEGKREQQINAVSEGALSADGPSLNPARQKHLAQDTGDQWGQTLVKPAIVTDVSSFSVLRSICLFSATDHLLDRYI